MKIGFDQRRIRSKVQVLVARAQSNKNSFAKLVEFINKGLKMFEASFSNVLTRNFANGSQFNQFLTRLTLFPNWVINFFRNLLFSRYVNANI